MRARTAHLSQGEREKEAPQTKLTLNDMMVIFKQNSSNDTVVLLHSIDLVQVNANEIIFPLNAQSNIQLKQ